MATTRRARVVVGVGTTLSGLQALRRAVAEARVLCAPLYAVRAWDPPPRSRYVIAPYATPLALHSRLSRRDFLRAEDAVYRLMLDMFIDTMGGTPVDVELHLVTVPGSPGAALARYANQENDLLVIGAERRRTWRRHSRTMRYCLVHILCPVLVVPPPPLMRGGSPRALVRELNRDLDELANDRSDWPAA